LSYTSEPKKLSLPEEAYYPVDRLNLFDRHDRRSWEKAFGLQAPPWDSRRAPKRWADTSALAGVEDPDQAIVAYEYFDLNSRTFQKLELTARQASLPNLPGKYDYPRFENPPTPAVMIYPNGTEEPLSPYMLCHRSEADALARELGASQVVDNGGFNEGPFQIDWRGELRRMWLIRLGQDLHSAALLLQTKYRDGVGAPGEWLILDSGQPTWISHAGETGERDARPEVPIPCRRLFPEEALYLGHPMKVIVYRKDKESEYNPGLHAPAGGGLTAAQAELLARIDLNVRQLLALGLTERK
jgi:hypothetical protein